jgi:putative transposase
MTYAFIDEHRDQYPVRTLCDVLDVSASGYYDWEDRDASAQVTRRAGLLIEIKRIHAEHHGRYGSPRIHAQLAAEGKVSSLGLIEKIMADNDIHAITRRKFRPATTTSGHDFPVAHNLLERNFRAFRPNEKWAADITYIPTGEGFIYLAAVMDLCTRKIVGWSMRDHMRTELTLAALMMAVQLQRPGAGLIHHSDRGSQYAAGEYAGKLADYGMRQSMSRKGDCWDNASMESFFHTLKTEHVHHCKFKTKDDARLALFDYINIYYNRKRIHSGIGYLTPCQMELKVV